MRIHLRIARRWCLLQIHARVLCAYTDMGCWWGTKRNWLPRYQTLIKVNIDQKMWHKTGQQITGQRTTNSVPIYRSHIATHATNFNLRNFLASLRCHSLEPLRTHVWWLLMWHVSACEREHLFWADEVTEVLYCTCASQNLTVMSWLRQRTHQ